MRVKYTLEVLLTSTDLDQDVPILHEAMRDYALELRAALQLLHAQPRAKGHVFPMPDVQLVRHGDTIDYEEMDLDKLQEEKDASE